MPTKDVKVDFGRSSAVERIIEHDRYLEARTGKYEYRALRYRAALNKMLYHGLDDGDTIIDVGAGWTEFDYCLRTEYDSMARYIPVDGCVDGTDLNTWIPPRKADFFVALELLEHLGNPARLVRMMQMRATKAIVISTPNTDELGVNSVLDMDSTHISPIYKSMLVRWGFNVWAQSFYGQPNDSLFAIWTP